MRLFIVLLGISLLAACTKPEENYIKIPSEFSAVLHEQLQTDNNRRNLYLELSSLDAKYCLYDSLVYNQTLINQNFSIEILDSYHSNNCLQRKHYLKSRILLPEFSDSLNIQIELGAASIIAGTIYKTARSYTLDIRQGTGLTSKHNSTLRIPENLLWGYAYPKSIDPTTETLMNNFRLDIEFDCNNFRLPPGFYSYFSILDDHRLVFEENPGIAGKILVFYYTHTKSEVELDLFFSQLAAQYANLVGYQINSGTGKEFHLQ
ncbi:MAG TPA: hypothetical protein VFX48_08410 [Saprospiraceae bacterium]|nr:hypothetical protein [Saprospiraceae bacterium]